MTTWRHQLALNPAVRFLLSVKITVGCLFWLFVLTFWGTVAQVHQGLYAAQERFFHSFYFLVMGFLPLPGAQLVLWILFLNLFTVALVRLRYQWNNIGIIIIHAGLLLYFVAAFVTLHAVRESQLTLKEGEGSNTSIAYHDWELALWPESTGPRQIVAYRGASLRPGHKLNFKDQNLQILVESFYPNAKAFTSQEAPSTLLNVSGIQTLKPIGKETEPEKNVAGGTFKLLLPGAEPIGVLLFGGEVKPLPFKIGQQNYFLILRKRHEPLPVLVKLLDFHMEVHPNTEIARKYESKVLIETQGLSREVLISMNNPLRYKDFTFYQASYAIDEAGQQYSTLAVVQNSGRLLPYVASLLTFVGLALHFILQGLKKRVVKHA